MTEPDEALLWARLRAKGRMSSPNNPHRTIARRVEVDAGKHDAELSDEAEAYRAGARMAREQERERAKVLVEFAKSRTPFITAADAALAKYWGEA